MTLTKDINYYYTQVFPRGDGYMVERFVTFASNPTEAKALAIAEARKRHPNCTVDEKDINLYHKNYIREARKMVEAGNYTGVNPLIK